MSSHTANTLWQLMALSPLDGRYAQATQALQHTCSEFALQRERVTVEVEWLIFLANQTPLLGRAVLTTEEHTFLREIIDHFTPESALEIKQIESQTRHDVKAVEYFLKARLETHPTLATCIPWIHFAATSEDVNNLSYGRLLNKTRQHVLLPQLSRILTVLKELTARYATWPMLSRTHGQAATPTTLGKELANVGARLSRQIDTLQQLPILGKWNGAVGNYNAHCVAAPHLDWPLLAQQFVTHMGLEFNAYTTQIEPHDYVAEWMHTLIRIHTILIDYCRDMWAYISLGYFRQHTIAGEVGSSTMPHKVNPIDFENAEGNLGIANALAEHLAMKLPISRWQRDLTDSTVLRNLGVVFGHAVVAYHSLLRGLSKVEADAELLQHDLAAVPEILAEAIQTVFRSQGLPEAYEALKAKTRGQSITLTELHALIQSSALSEDAKQRLLNLRPSTYTGVAAQLAEAFTQIPQTEKP